MSRSNASGRAERLETLRVRHRRLEEKIDAFNAQEFMTPREQTERKRLQKLKLAIRDELAELQQPPRGDDTA